MDLHFLAYVVLVLIVVGTLVFLAMRAPFIDAEWKGYIKYAALVGTVLWFLFLIVEKWPHH